MGQGLHCGGVCHSGDGKTSEEPAIGIQAQDLVKLVIERVRTGGSKSNRFVKGKQMNMERVQGGRQRWKTPEREKVVSNY